MRARARRSPRVDVDELASVFTWTDGTSTMFTCERTYEREAAEMLWPRARARTWQLWQQTAEIRLPVGAPWPAPGGARAYDGFTRRLQDLERSASVAQRRAAARSDLRAAEAWAKAHPVEAATIAGPLADYMDRLARARKA